VKTRLPQPSLHSSLRLQGQAAPHQPRERRRAELIEAWRRNETARQLFRSSTRVIGILPAMQVAVSVEAIGKRDTVVRNDRSES
jgi:hypothetical protein